jgi:Holliday junction resolvase
MPAYARRRDLSEPQIVAALEKAGCDVLRASDVDLIVGRAGATYLVECKTPGKDAKRLRPIQKRLRSSWRGHYAIVETPEQALCAVGL